MNSEDEEELIESNSSENTPPLSYNEIGYLNSKNQTASFIKSTTTTTTNTVIMPSFEDLFEKFIQANSSKSICKSFENIVKLLNIDTQHVFEHTYTFSNNQQNNNNNNNNNTNRFFQQPQQPNTRLLYQIIKSKTNYWKANELWKKYDKRASLKDYLLTNNKMNSSDHKDLNVLIIGGGPVGLRLSIECALLGLRCTIVEKRDKFSRNNVLHLWPYTIVDLKNLGAKLFYGKFCAGSIDHISIRKLQCILLKVALLFGVQVHFNTSFEEIIEPTNFIESMSGQQTGWRVRLLPENHPLAYKTFDVVIGADGRRNTLPGFNRKEFRGRLAIGITANFVNYYSAEEAKVEERSGVAFIFDQKFFLDLRSETNIDLENIVYYKDDTHYFVMTAKRQSLIEKGVIKQDFQDAAKLLSKENVNFEALCDYAKLAAYVSTNRKLRTLDFAKNHYGQPDVAMFDFTSLFQSENASRIIERKGKKIFLSLVGDSLLEPFWPTGTGIARGFLAAFDTAWAIKRLAMNHNMLEVLSERESIYQLLSQTTHDNVNKNYQEYTIDPTTRYVNLKHKIFSENQIKHLYDNGTKPLNSIENSMPTERRMKSEYVQSDTILRWCQIVVQPYGIRIENFTNSWKDGLAFCAIIHRFRNELIDYTSLNENTSTKNISLLLDVMQNKLGLSTNFKAEDLIKNGISHRITVLMILDKLYSVFKNNQITEVEIESENEMQNYNNMINNKRKANNNQEDLFLTRKSNRPPVQPILFDQTEEDEPAEKFNPVRRNSLKNINVSNLADILKSKLEPQIPSSSISTTSNTAKTNLNNLINQDNNNYQTISQNNNQVKPFNSHVTNTSDYILNRPKNNNNVHHFSFPISKPNPNAISITNPPKTTFSFKLSSETTANSSTPTAGFYLQSICADCGNKVSIMERQNVLHLVLHTHCFKCKTCGIKLNSSSYEHRVDLDTRKYSFYCSKHKPISINSVSKVFDEKDYLKENSNQRNIIDISSSYRESDDYSRKNYDSSFVRRSRILESEEVLSATAGASSANKRHSFTNISTKSDNIPNNNRYNEYSNKPNYITPERAEFEFELTNQYEDDDEYETDDDYDEDDQEEEEETGSENSESDEISDNNIKNESNESENSEEEEDEDEEDDEEEEEEDDNNNKKNNFQKEQKQILETFKNIENDLDEMKTSQYNIDLKETSSSTESKTDLTQPTLKFKKFNLDKKIENTNMHMKEIELIDRQRKQEVLKVQNEIEKNKNLLRELLYEKSNSQDSITSRLKNTYFNCQMCNQQASITQRTRVFGAIYHRDCIKCIICNVIVRNAESLSQKDQNGQNVFYCIDHVPEEPPPLPLSPPPDEPIINLEFKNNDEENDGSDLSTCSCSTQSSKWSNVNKESIPILEKSASNLTQPSNRSSSNDLKSASPLFNIPNSNKKLDTNLFESNSDSNISNHLSPASTSESSSNNYEKVPIIKEQSKIIIDCQLMRQRALEKARLKSDEELGVKVPNNIKRLIMPISSLSNKPLENDNVDNFRNLEIVSTKTVNTSLEMNKFESKTETDSEVEEDKNEQITPAPLAKSETFENIDEIKKSATFSTSPGSSSSMSPSPLSKKQSFKIKISKLLSNSSSVSASSRSTKSPSPSNPLSLAKKIGGSGILKSIFSPKSTNKILKEDDFKYLTQNNFESKHDLETSVETNASGLNTSGSCSSLSNLNENSAFIGSFNALNVTNSPRLSRNTRTAKLNQKKQENEEKRLEKQRQNKRLRMSQEIQRKIDEIETKAAELEQAGDDLERIICSTESIESKQKLEQELYNIIHQRNLLTRFENELNIQTRALAIEDKLSESKQKLRETINLPECEKSSLVMESEKQTMEKIVEYVEEKNQLVEQLESLRVLEREEDSEITKIFSGKIFNFDRESNLLNKFEIYQDII